MPPKQIQVASVYTPHHTFRKIAQHVWIGGPHVTVLFLFGDSPSILFQRKKYTSAVFPFKWSCQCLCISSILLIKTATSTPSVDEDLIYKVNILI